MQNRRTFIKTAGVATGTALLSGPVSALASMGERRLTILHTNDVHSHIDPFPMDGTRYQGLGGCARRLALIKEIRRQEPEVLLFDAGDIFQGTPYFNMFGGEPELKLMSQMGYNAATMGNHDFDNGIEGFHKQLPNANFPIIVSNYDFSNTIMHDSYVPYKIFKAGSLKVGVFGLGIELQGLVDKRNYKETVYLNPLPIANQLAERLKNDYRCNLVVCLSHLGYSYTGSKISDLLLASSTSNIDLIIGGHTHTFLPRPVVVKNAANGITLVNQVGFAGINLGRIDYVFTPTGRSHTTTNTNYLIQNA